MPEVVRIYEHGGPAVLKHEQLELPAPGPREVLVRHTAIGLNFADIYMRDGLYARTLPSGLGTEAAGVVERVGRRVSEFKPGQRVAYYWSEPGAYASARVLPADVLLRLNTPEARRGGARELFSLIRRRAIRVHIGQRYPLAQAAQAQRDLAVRRTLGSTVLLP